MERVTIIDKGLSYDENALQSRSTTDCIVLHHSGTGYDCDLDSVGINRSHQQGNGWTCIGYHYVIRKDGTIEQGRPLWAVGAHCQGDNYHTIGIHFSGDFEEGRKPTDAQMISGAQLIANLCTDFGIPIDRNHIKGHKDFMATDCPGTGLYNQMDKLIGDANFFAASGAPADDNHGHSDNDIQYLLNQGYTRKDAIAFLDQNRAQQQQKQAVDTHGHSDNDIQYLLNQGYTLEDAIAFLDQNKAEQEAKAKKEAAPKQETTSSDPDDIKVIASLSGKYESSGDPGSVSSGEGDLGGVSYGCYQLASNCGAVEPFLEWGKKYKKPELANYAVELDKFRVNSPEFKSLWRKIGATDPVGFEELQAAYIKTRFYDVAASSLKKHGYDIEKHSTAMKAVLFSRSVQYGPGNMVDLYETAVKRMGQPNLSYVNDKYFDKDVITNIYDFLVKECDDAYQKGSYYHSPEDWANGSYTVVKVGLRNRFVNEKNDALEMLAKE